MKRTARGIMAGGAALVALLATAPMMGCGGGSKSNSGGTAASRARGSVSLTVQWPDKTRVIPLAAQSIRVVLVRTAPGPSVQPTPTIPLLTPPPTTQSTNRISTATASNLELGTYHITVTAYSTTDGTGTPVAVAAVDQAVVAGTNNPLTITMNATVTRVTVTPPTGPNLRVGKTRQFTATAFDASNNIVAIDPKATVWTSTPTSVVTVDANGLATMTGVGTGTVRATYTEPFTPNGQEGTGAFGEATVVVVPTVAPWPKFRNDLQNTGVTTQGDPTTGVERWRFGTQDHIVFSSPAIGVDSVAYVGAYNNNVYAVNPDGTQKWVFTTGGAIDSSPAIGNNVIYVGSYDQNMYALSTTNGQKVWSFPTDGPVVGSPSLVNGVLYFASSEPGGTVYAVDAISGTKLWSKSLGTGIQTCPAFSLDQTTLYVGGLNGNLYALNAQTGNQVWAFATGPEGIFSSSPAVGSNGTIYVGSLNGKLFGVLPNGTIAPNFPVSTGAPIYTSPAISRNGTVYFGTFDNISGLADSRLYAINGTTGAQVWTFRVGDGITSSPAIGADGVVYFGSYDGNLYAVNSDGSPKWQFFIGDNIDSSPGIGLDGEIYVGAYSGILFSIK